MREDREAWLDVLRGATITLVIFHHALWAAWEWLNIHGSSFHWSLHNLSSALEMARMPAFFLCSGILFTGPMHRGWSWFVSARLLWATWIVIVWTALTALAATFGILHYPWDTDAGLTIWNALLISPYGNLWFIYAITILGAAAILTCKLSNTIRLVIVVISSFLMIAAFEYFAMPHGLETLTWNLGARGILFFS